MKDKGLGNGCPSLSCKRKRGQTNAIKQAKRDRPGQYDTSVSSWVRVASSRQEHEVTRLLNVKLP